MGTTPEKSPEIPKEVNSPLNLSKPRKEEPNNNNNKAESEKPNFGAYDEELANFELLRKRKYFLDQNKSFPAVSPPQLFPHTPALNPKLPPHPYLSGNEFPYPPFRSFPGFENRSAVAATAAAVGILPPMGQPAAAAGLAALRNSASLGLHQVSMIDQVRHEHQRQQQQQQQQQQPQQQTEDGLNCTRKFYTYKVSNILGSKLYIAIATYKVSYILASKLWFVCRCQNNSSTEERQRQQTSHQASHERFYDLGQR